MIIVCGVCGAVDNESTRQLHACNERCAINTWRCPVWHFSISSVWRLVSVLWSFYVRMPQRHEDKLLCKQKFAIVRFSCDHAANAIVTRNFEAILCLVCDERLSTDLKVVCRVVIVRTRLRRRSRHRARVSRLELSWSRAVPCQTLCDFQSSTRWPVTMKILLHYILLISDRCMVTLPSVLCVLTTWMRGLEVGFDDIIR